MTPFREALIDAVIDGWQNGDPVFSVAQRAARVSGEPLDGCLNAMGAAFGVKYVFGKESIKTALPKLSPAVNDMLWAGRRTEVIRDALRRRFGGLNRKGHLMVAKRSLDKRHDWNTVK